MLLDHLSRLADDLNTGLLKVRYSDVSVIQMLVICIPTGFNFVLVFEFTNAGDCDSNDRETNGYGLEVETCVFLNPTANFPFQNNG